MDDEIRSTADQSRAEVEGKKNVYQHDIPIWTVLVPNHLLIRHRRIRQEIAVVVGVDVVGVLVSITQYPFIKSNSISLQSCYYYYY